MTTKQELLEQIFVEKLPLEQIQEQLKRTPLEKLIKFKEKYSEDFSELSQSKAKKAIAKKIKEEKIFKKAESLIEKYGRLDMIYLRVSTDGKGQQEEDQLPDIINTFNLKKEECLIVRAKESAFKEEKQEKRDFKIFFKLIEKFKDIDKTLYLWDLDRIYRNQKRQAQFICYFADRNNCKVLSFRQKFLHQFKDMQNKNLGRMMYNFMIELFGYMAEEESKKKSDRVKKSLSIKNGRTYSNKGNLYGRKLLKEIRNGKKIYYTDKQLDVIEAAIIKRIKEKVSYSKIIQQLYDIKQIKISKGYITNIKNKLL